MRLALGCALVIAGASAAHAQARPNPFANAKTWAFQLKNLDPAQQAKLAASPYDVLVIDSEDYPGGKERPLTRAEVEGMKKKPDGSKRLVISYFSVGEAESYRYYWKPEWTKKKPSWVGKENKEWKENFLVKYWEPTWQNIIFGNPEAFADRVIAQGFDGFYIDRADAYYYFGDNADVRQKMRDFIIKLTTYMRAKKPDVAILVQNAEELLDNKPYVDAIDGIAKEDLLYGISHKEERNKTDDVSESTALLKKAQDSGKKIFVIEYLTRAGYIADAKKRLDDLGFVMYTGPRGLGEMVDPNAIANGVAAAAKVSPEPEPKPTLAKKVKDKAKALLNR
jgi:cysteinyl-tRNA synthetase, unknown class